MKVSREQAARNRERIVETAAQLFRERGFEGIGVADLMKAAGLTHGGFYALIAHRAGRAGHWLSAIAVIDWTCAEAHDAEHITETG